MQRFNLKLAGKMAATVVALSLLLGNLAFEFPDAVALAVMFWVLNLPAGLILFVIGRLTDLGAGPGDKESYLFAMTLTTVFATSSAVIWAIIVGFVFRTKEEPIKPPQTTSGSSAPTRV